MEFIGVSEEHAHSIFSLVKQIDDSSVLKVACSSEAGKYLHDYKASQLRKQLS